jgi:hypothetical protein
MRLGHGVTISDIVKHYKEKEKEISHIIEFCLNNQPETKVGCVEINDNLILVTVSQVIDGRVVFLAFNAIAEMVSMQ